jgi:hypothetical protein
MGQFKPMTKMMTTEPSVELKLKKGGSVAKVDDGAMPMRRPMPMMPMRRPMPSAMPAPAMKEGGKADMAQDKAMIKKAMKQHDMQEHKGGKGTTLKLKQGGKMATGGVVNGQGGFKTGGVVDGQGGFKKGGGVKKYAKGGMIDSGRPEQMPQGKKKPTPPVAINQLAGTFKKGGIAKC